MKRFLELVNKGLRAIFRLLELYAKVVLVAVVVIVSAQVVCRKFFRYSIIWSEEVALLFMVWVAFISMAIGVAKKLHIAIQVFYDKFHKPVKKAAQVIEYLCTLFCGVILMIYGTRLVEMTMRSTLPTTKWPSAILYLMVPVGGFFMVYCTLLQIFFPATARTFAEDQPAAIETTQEKEGGAL